MRERVMGPLSSLVAGAAGAAGTVLGITFAVTARIRQSKPLHPVGIVARAALTVTPPSARSGSPLLDEPGEYECLVRASYAMGSGPQRPDIEGFALRILPSGLHTAITDILFASTGDGPLGRHILAVRPPAKHRSQTTLLPVRAADRPLQLRLDPLDPRSQPWPASYELSWAHGRGRWHPMGELTVNWFGTQDALERFDPVINELPGTSQYAAVAWLRAPAYRMARLAWSGNKPTQASRATDVT